MGEIIAAHAVLFLEMTDDGLDRRPAFELAFDLRRDAALLAGGVDLEHVIGRGIVAAIAGIGDAAIDQVADECFHLWNDRGERVPVIGITRQHCDVGDKLAAGGMLCRGGNASVYSDLVGPVRLALADALNLRRMQRIDLAAALPALLFQHPPSQGKWPKQRLLQALIAGDATLDVADDAAELGLELA